MTFSPPVPWRTARPIAVIAALILILVAVPAMATGHHKRHHHRMRCVTHTDHRSRRRHGRRVRYNATVQLPVSGSGCRFTSNSYNQRMIYTPDGIFASWLSSDSGSPTCSCSMTVGRSTDNGASWTTLLTLPIRGEYPGVVEADTAGNIYVFAECYQCWGGGSDARMYIFPKASGYQNDGTNYITIPGGATDKYSSAYDPSSNHLYFMKGDYTAGSTFRLYTIDASTHAILSNVNMLKSGSDSNTSYFPHYPQMYVDQSGGGLTVYAWTNTSYSNSSSYYDIHFIVSTDGGSTWIGKNGIIPSSSFPIDSGNSGPSFALLAPSEVSTTANNWLESMYAQDGKLLFMYANTQTGAVHYRRFDWATKTNDVFLGSPVCGSLLCVNQFTGFFSGNGTAGSTIYFTGATQTPLYGVVTLYSNDDGATWHGYASTSGTFGFPYAVSGSRRLGPNGEIIGAFSDQNNAAAYFLHTGFS